MNVDRDECWMCEDCGEVYDIPVSEADEITCPACGSDNTKYFEVPAEN